MHDTQTLREHLEAILDPTIQHQEALQRRRRTDKEIQKLAKNKYKKTVGGSVKVHVVILMFAVICCVEIYDGILPYEPGTSPNPLTLILKVSVGACFVLALVAISWYKILCHELTFTPTSPENENKEIKLAVTVTLQDVIVTHTTNNLNCTKLSRDIQRFIRDCKYTRHGDDHNKKRMNDFIEMIEDGIHLLKERIDLLQSSIEIRDSQSKIQLIITEDNTRAKTFLIEFVCSEIALYAVSLNRLKEACDAFISEETNPTIKRRAYPDLCTYVDYIRSHNTKLQPYQGLMKSA